jgi:hypothetical protein
LIFAASSHVKNSAHKCSSRTADSKIFGLEKSPEPLAANKQLRKLEYSMFGMAQRCVTLKQKF